MNGKDGDFDGDGWNNYEEYLLGFDPGNNTDPLPSPPEILETIPHPGAGIDPDATRVAHNTSFAAYIEDADGIDVTDPASISYHIVAAQISRPLSAWFILSFLSGHQHSTRTLIERITNVKFQVIFSCLVVYKELLSNS